MFSRKVLSICLEWKAKVNEALRTLLAFQLCDPYLSAVACNSPETQVKDITFPSFMPNVNFRFVSWSKKVKVSEAAHTIEESAFIVSGK